jgi:glycosyltransferase involved in cell wall biosynthesis
MLFSVIIPVYNGMAFLKGCIDSVLNQDFADGTNPSDIEMELILVDDGSTDGSSELCDRYAENDARIRVIHQANSGQPSARRAGIFASKGDYICYVDADDKVRPYWLSTIADCIRKGKNPDLLVFGAVFHGEDKDERNICWLPEGLYTGARLRKEVFPYALADRRKCYTTRLIPPAPWNKAYRRELLLAHYNREERLRRREDVAFVYECAFYSRSIYVTHKILYDYNKTNPDSITASYGCRLTVNDVYLSYYLRSRLAGLGVDSQINDFFLCRIIRSTLWKAANEPYNEAKANLRKELADTKLLEHVRLRGLPPGPAVFLLALRLGLYGPILRLARIKEKGIGAA